MNNNRISCLMYSEETYENMPKNNKNQKLPPVYSFERQKFAEYQPVGRLTDIDPIL